MASAERINKQEHNTCINLLPVTLTEQDSADMTALVTDREVNNQVAAFPEGSIQKPVVSITSDGNSPNRKFYRICGLDPALPLTYKTTNPFADREIYFFCDPPHLLKTSRNCFANSFCHSKSRTLWVSKLIS